MAGNSSGLDLKPGDVAQRSDSEIGEPSKLLSKTLIAQSAQDAAADLEGPDYNLPSTARENLPPETSLVAIFRFHMGIENDASLVPSHLAQKKAIDPIATGSNKGRRAVNLGIYNRAIREERTCIVQYKIWSAVINLALGLQIIFAAILTALGAGHGPADAVAIFGALNTIIAGFLTYIKGTGLPMRMKYFHNHWLKLRAYIEQRERDFASDDHTGIHRLGYKELMEEIDIIEKMYHNMRKDIERHTPDSFSGNKGEDSHAEAGAPGEGATQKSLASKGIKAAAATTTAAASGETFNRIRTEMEHRIHNLIEDVENRLSTRVSHRISQLEGSKGPGGQTSKDATQVQTTDLERGPDPDV